MANRGVTWAKDFFKDIEERQVNTIVAEGITGRAMTDPGSGLKDIAKTYYKALKDDGFGLQLGDPVSEHELMEGGVAAFQMLETLAKKALAESNSKDLRHTIYQRISSTSSELKAVVYPNGVQAKQTRAKAAISNANGNGDSDSDSDRVEVKELSELDPNYRAVIVKAWELGVSEVAMQTTIGLDGDLVTRIARQYLGESGAVVRQLHEASVRTSIGTWESLIKGIIALARGPGS